MLAAGEVPGYLGPVAALVVAAAVIGYLTARARVVPIVGFLVAGVLLGPAQLGLVENSETVQAAADIGVILLLFTIGIEFSLERLAQVWTWIVVAGGLQLVLATGAGLLLTLALGGDWRDGVFTGFLISLSSTAIVLKLLEGRRETSTVRGRLSVAVLISQDLAVVGMVLVVPLLGSGAGEGESGWGSLVRAVVTAVGVVVAVLLVARRVMPPLLDVVARTCLPEVFLLAVVAVCFGTAYLTALAGVSVSLGAFLAGLVISESRASTHVLAEVLPLQIIFSAVFFVSVGMLLDLGFVLDNAVLVLGAAVVVLVAKALTAGAAAAAARVRARTAAATACCWRRSASSPSSCSRWAPPPGSPRWAAARTDRSWWSPRPCCSCWAARRWPRRRRGWTVRAAGGPCGSGRRGEVVDHDAPFRDHVVIIGWGPTALDLAETLRQRGVPVVLTTLNPDGAAEAEAAGLGWSAATRPRRRSSGQRCRRRGWSWWPRTATSRRSGDQRRPRAHVGADRHPAPGRGGRRPVGRGRSRPRRGPPASPRRS